MNRSKSNSRNKNLSKIILFFLLFVNINVLSQTVQKDAIWASNTC